MTNENSETTFSLTPGNKPGFSLSRLLTSPLALIRLSSVLCIGLTVGHMSGYPWTSAQNRQESRLAGAMKSVDLVFLGERSSYWNLYFGWGLWVGVLMLALAIILWLLPDIASIAPRRAGAITGVIAVTCLIGAYVSFRFFFIPPFVMLCIMFLILLAATMQLLKKSNLMR